MQGRVRKYDQLKNFMSVALTEYKHLGTFFPSSSYACRRITSMIPRANAKIVEYGSGNGVLTDALLRHLDESSHLIGIEIVDDFANQLMQKKDPRFSCIHGDVVAMSRKLPELAPLGLADAVVSGIPFSFLKPALRDEIVKNTWEGLKPGGVFIVYQNSPAMLKTMKKHFDDVRLVIEPLNLPPYFISVGRKSL